MTSIRFPHAADSRHPVHAARGTTVRTLLLVCGLLSSALYVIVDLIAAAQYPGYSLRDQAISELSAVGAPTASLWSAMGAAYGILFVAFSIGVLRASGGNHRIRRTGILLLVFILAGLLWRVVPMHERGAERTWQDVGHLVVGGMSLALILAFISSGAVALGARFRAFSIATWVIVLACGSSVFAYVPRTNAGESTPWLGIVERIFIYGYLLWVAVFAVAVARRLANRESAAARST